MAQLAAERLRRYGQHLGTIPASASSAVLWAADFSTGDTSETQYPTMIIDFHLPVQRALGVVS